MIIIMKKLIIEQLKEGFNLIDEIGEKYAVSSKILSTRVKAYFGVTDHSKQKKAHTKKTIAPPAKVSEATKPETQGSTTPDSHSGGATSQSSSTEHMGSNPASGGGKDPELKNRTETSKDTKPNDDVMNGTIPSEPKLGTPDNKLVQCGQCAEILETPGFDSPAAPLIMHPSDLKIAKFDYDLLAKTQKYKTLEVLELPDGRVVLKYGAVRYYTSKDLVMQIQFPFLKEYFIKENGWSSSVEQAFKFYRRYLAERKEPEGQPEGTCDDQSFDSCANNNPETCKFCVNESRYEDKRKLAAKKPGKPLLKASMGV